jgi:hypothetical protein
MAMSQEKFKKLTQYGVMGLVALVVSPIIFMVIKGIVGLAIAGVIGAVLIALMPAFSEKMAQLKFQALKGVVSRAPVESLHQRAKERRDELTTQRNTLQEQAAALAEFKNKAQKFNRDFPEEAPAINEQLAGYEKLFAYRVDMFKEAKVETDRFMKVVEKAEAIYEMAVIDAKLGKSFNKGKDFMSIYREKTAFDAIDKANSMALANLKMALVDDEFASKKVEAQTTAQHAITYDPAGNPILGNILDVRSIEIPVART